MNRIFSYLPPLPDASLRKPLTIAEVAPVILCYYAHAVMAMLPYTFWFRVALLPFTVWLAWDTAVTLDAAQYLANTLGLASNPLRISHLNFLWVVSVSRISQWRSYAELAFSAGYVGYRPQSFRMDVHH